MDANTFAGNWARPLNPDASVPAGSLVYFNGHVGIVKSYDPVTRVGEFLSMTGSGGVGTLKPSETFTTDRNLNPRVYWGGNAEFKGLAAVKPELYDSSLDQHANGANPNTPVFNIPEATNAGFVTLPDNGGFSWSKGTKDLSALPNVVAAGQNFALPQPIDAPLPTTAFAEALAALEARDQPDNGYAAINSSGGGIGAIGRYGFRAPSLKAIGWMDDTGNWTDKARVNGVNDPDSFRANHEAQETARVAYMGVIKSELKANGAWAMIGQEVDGRVVTESGLIAAGWKEGSLNVLKFFSGESTNVQKDTNILFRIDRFQDAPMTGATAATSTLNIGYPLATRTFSDGSIQTEYTAKADSADSSIKKGDAVLEVVDKEGAVTLRSVDHIEDNSTEVFGNEGGLQNYDRWDGNGVKTDSLLQDAQSLRGYTREGTAQSSNPMGDGNSLQQNDLQMPGGAVTSSTPFIAALTVGAPTGAPSTASAGSPLNPAISTNHITTVVGAASDPLTFKLTNGKQIKAGDELNGPDGRLVSFDGVKDTLIVDVKIGENLYERRTYSGSGQVSIQSWEYATDQLDGETGEPGQYFNGDVYQIRGDTFIFATGIGLVHQGTGEVAASPAEINQFILAESKMPLHPVAYEVVTLNGQVYEAKLNGTLERRIPDHPDWIESRDGTGAGIIIDRNGNTIAQLEKDDRVGQMDDGRISIHDAGGKTVDRLVDEAFSGSFVVPISVVSPANEVPNPALAGDYRNVLDLQSDRSTAAILSVQAAAQQATQAAGALGLINTIVGLQHWDQQSDLSHLSTAVALYSQLNAATGGALGASSGIGNLAGVGAGLGLLASLESGNVGGILSNGIALGNFAFDGAVSSALGSTLGIDAANVVPGLGLVLSLSTGDPLSIIAAAVAFIPVYGQIASVIISILGGLFADEKPDLPMQEGQAQAQWDADGNITITTTQDNYGGGEHAVSWMTSIARGLQNQLASQVDSEGQPVYSLIPQRLPSIGFVFDPDGFNYASALGHMTLSWLDESGQTETRYYDGAGRHYVGVGDDLGETLAGDFMAHVQASHAIVPTWEAKTILAHFSEAVAGQGITAANAQAAAKPQSAMPQEQADGVHQVLNALTFEVPTAVASRIQAQPMGLVDTDGDGYLEQTQWVNANQAMIAIDANLDGNITGGELLNMGGNNTARNSPSWLDTNHDNRLDARDPSFAALRIWLDASQDGVSQQGEIQSFAQARITAIDFACNPAAIIWADGTTSDLTIQRLEGDILGVRYQAVEGGLLETKEKGETVLNAVNTRLFDAQAKHMHGGFEETRVGVSDARLSTITANTVANTSIQTQATVLAAAITSGRTGGVRAGTVQGQQAAAALIASGNAQLRSNPIAFIPGAGGGTAAQAQREATQEMMRSADSGLFSLSNASGAPLVAMALGAGAVQWPAVTDAASIVNLSSSDSGSYHDVDLIGVLDGVSGSDNRRANTSEPHYLSVFDAKASSDQEFGRVELANLQVGQVTSIAGSSYSSVAAQNSDLTLLSQNPAQQTRAQPAANSTTDQGRSHEDSNYSNSNSNSASASASAASSDVSATRTSTIFSATTAALTYPTVRGELVAGTEDVGLRITTASLLANDNTLNTARDPASLNLSVSAVGAPSHGQVALRMNEHGQPEIVFIPEANYHGQASFDYTVTDQYGLSSTGTATLQIAAVNDVPVTQGETASGNEDTTLVFASSTLLANDMDVDTAIDGDVLRITRVGLAQHGTVFLDVNGNTRFVPDQDYNGAAQFTYWVADRDAAALATGTGYEVAALMNLTVLAINDLPVVIGEAVASDEDIVLNIAQSLLLANDTDVDIATNGQTLSISAVSNAQHGTVTLQANGSIQFIPERNYFGAASFVYTVDDGSGQVTGTAIVNLAPVNDAPDVVGETITFDEDSIQTVTQAALLANDSDVDNAHEDLRILSVGNASHGTISLNPDGSIRYAPDADYYGAASFTYTVSDGEGGFTVGTASLNILPVNDAPVTLGEAATLDEDTIARFSSATLLANDRDVDNLHSELQISAVGDATHGTVQLVAGEVVFTPTANYFGTASFGYTVSDGVGGLANATVNLTFNSVNDAPVVNNELLMGKRDITYTLSQATLLANDTDVETPGGLTIVVIQNCLHGTGTLAANGDVIFTPTAVYAGRGSFDYVVQDADGGQTVGTAQIDYSRTNTSPLAVDDSFFGYEDTSFIIAGSQLMVNDSDPDASGLTRLSVDVVGNATNGYVTLRADGSVRFDPVANFYGSATFDYRLNDGEGGQTWARAYLTVTSVNDAPVVEDIWYGTPIYGYARSAGPTDESGNPTIAYSAVASEWSAISLANAGALYTSGGVATSVSFYQNGHARPMSITNAIGVDESGNPILAGYQQSRVMMFDPDGDSNGISFSLVASPAHGATEALGGGSWNYYSHYGDPYTGADPYTVRGTDSGGATVEAVVYPTHYGTSVAGGGGGGGCPIAIDLNGDGVNLIRAEDSSIYADINHSGWRQRLGWTDVDDGVLVFDGNRDNMVDLDTEISFTHFKQGARTDLEGLVGLDSNGDGKISAEDNEWGQLKVFKDANGNGLQDAGELMQLAAVGITSIGLERHGTPQLDHGNVVFGIADVSFADGHVANAADVMFTPQNAVLSNVVRTILGLPLVPDIPAGAEAPVMAAPTATVAAPPQETPAAEQAQIMQAALLFNQYCNADSTAIESLGYVNWAQAEQDQVLDFMANSGTDHTLLMIASASAASNIAHPAQSFA